MLVLGAFARLAVFAPIRADGRQVSTPELLSCGEAARRLGVSRSTVNRLVSEGRIAAHRYSPRGHYRIPAAEVARLLDGSA